MEPEIKHVRFFNGQFLQQGEFREEQDYHIHMRRRINYVLFEDGVVQINASDLTIAPETANPADKRLRVLRGMAIGSNHVTFEAKEIINRNDSQIFDLAALGFVPGQTVFVTVNHLQADTDPVSVGGVVQTSRTAENIQIDFHTADPTGDTTAAGDPLIVLGSIDFSTMVVTDSTPPRQRAVLRAAVQGGAAPVSPTVIGISTASGAPGALVNATISGTNLGGATAVIFSGAGVTATIQPGGSPTTVNVQITIALAAPAGPRTFTVNTPQGPATSGAVVFSVAVPLGLPTINPWLNNADRRRNGTETLTILGDQFGAPFEVLFPPAAPGPDVVVLGTVANINQGSVVVPGPFIPTPGDPALVASGAIRVRTPAGTSAPSPQAFILDIV
jgi:hypothetical protein